MGVNRLVVFLGTRGGALICVGLLLAGCIGYVQVMKSGASSGREEKIAVEDQNEIAYEEADAESGTEVTQKNNEESAVVSRSRDREYRIEVSVAEQRVRVYRAGRLVREMVCSTGTPDSPTPRGLFYIQNRGEWFFSQKYKQGGKWWVSFYGWGQYLFHSVPLDSNQEVIPEEAAKLGQPASHGCIRLAMEDARWIYDHIPRGAPVHIY